MTNTNLADLSYLVVDDESNTRDVFKVLLEKVIGSTQVETMADNSQFLDDLAALPFLPNVAFIDLIMQPNTGYDLLKMLREDSRYQSTCIFAITARVMSHDIEKMQAAGFDGLISKPVVRQIFPELLQRIVTGEKLWYVA